MKCAWYGCRAVSCQHAGCDGHLDGHPLPEGAGHLCPTGIQTFIQALEKVALLNGMSRDKPGFLQSWQHSTIARRVGFLHSLLTDPWAERQLTICIRSLGALPAYARELVQHLRADG